MGDTFIPFVGMRIGGGTEEGLGSRAPDEGARYFLLLSTRRQAAADRAAAPRESQKRLVCWVELAMGGRNRRGKRWSETPKTGRDIPDVSLMAGSAFLWPWSSTSGIGYPICFTGSGGVSCESAPDLWPSGNGTSFSTSIMAGFQALVNQKTGERQGNPNPVYYELANTEYGSQGNSSCASVLGPASSCIFYDETVDELYTVPMNNSVPCTGTVDCYYPIPGEFGEISTSGAAVSFQTSMGWDFPTGIGSINAANLVNNWPTPKK
jgi:hypothetical protein